VNKCKQTKWQGSQLLRHGLHGYFFQGSGINVSNILAR